MKFRVTAAPYMSTRDGRLYVNVEHGYVLENIRLADNNESTAIDAIARTLHVSAPVAKRALTNVGTWVTGKQTTAPPKRNASVLDTHARKVKR